MAKPGLWKNLQHISGVISKKQLNLLSFPLYLLLFDNDGVRVSLHTHRPFRRVPTTSHQHRYQVMVPTKAYVDEKKSSSFFFLNSPGI